MLRASDFDREQVVDLLRTATAEGRLRADELEERLSAALAARTYGELDPLVEDLPAPRPAPPRRRPGLAVWAATTLTLGVVLTWFAILSAGSALHVHAGQRLLHGRPEVFYLASHHGFFPVIAGPVIGLLAIVVLCVAVSRLFVSVRSPAHL